MICVPQRMIFMHRSYYLHMDLISCQIGHSSVPPGSCYVICNVLQFGKKEVCFDAFLIWIDITMDHPDQVINLQRAYREPLRHPGADLGLLQPIVHFSWLMLIFIGCMSMSPWKDGIGSRRPVELVGEHTSEQIVSFLEVPSFLYPHANKIWNIPRHPMPERFRLALIITHSFRGHMVVWLGVATASSIIGFSSR